MDLQKKIDGWFVPLSCSEKTLSSAYQELQEFGLKQEEIPYIIQIVENPKFDLPGGDIFHGKTDIETHDYLHIILGRGVLAKDEAFVIGFTMGSSNRVTSTEESLYSFFAKYLYPKAYRFTDEDLRVFKDAVKLGFISDCQPLSEVDYSCHLQQPLGKIREDLGIETNLLHAYYTIEKRRHPGSQESQRLLS